ncbi:MAG: prepilin peptidase, partial [Candidatus Paceibacterota bacterium]
YVLLRGACRGCKSKISLQYPLVELVTGLLFLAVWLTLSANFQFHIFNFQTLALTVLAPTLYYFVIFSLLVVIFVYDLRHKIIPDVFSYSFAGLALAGLLVAGSMSGFDTAFWLDLAAGPLLFLPFWALWYFSGGTWMGLGDGKLALGIGWFLGLASGVSAVVLGFWIGATVAVILLALQQLHVSLPIIGGKLGLKSEIPFGPFLIIGIIIQSFFEFDLLSLSLLF